MTQQYTPGGPNTGQQGSQQWQPPHGQSQPGYQPGGVPQPVKPSPLATIMGAVALVGALASLLSTFPTWFSYEGMQFGDQPVQMFDFNGWEQMIVNIEEGRVYGWLMLVSLIAVIAGVTLVLTGFIGNFTTRAPWPQRLMLGGAIAGLAGGLGLVIGYAVLDAGYAMSWATWLYGLAWIVVLIAAIIFANARRPLRGV